MDREEKTNEPQTPNRVENSTNEHQEHPEDPKASKQTIIERIVYYVGGVIMALLALRFILALLGANRENAFADLIFSISSLFASPFFGLFSYEPQYGVSTLELGTLVAIFVYGLVTYGIALLVGLTRR